MRDHRPTGNGIRGLIGSLALFAVSVVLTWNVAVPLAFLQLVALAAGLLLVRAHHHRDQALQHARAQQRRADILARPRPTDVTALRYGDPDQHVGHTDREAVLNLLTERYATGYLDADDFEARATTTGEARTRSQLARVLRNLPHP